METVHKVKDRENGCPFGMRCDDCNFYIPMYNTDERGSVTQEYNCTINNIAILQSEMKDRVLGMQQAAEGVRNVVMGARAQLAQEPSDALLEDK